LWHKDFIAIARVTIFMPMGWRTQITTQRKINRTAKLELAQTWQGVTKGLFECAIRRAN